jgi:HAD superfamily hydrolase (TIGR01509 family)
VRDAPLRAVLLDVGNTLLHLDYGWIAAALRARGLAVDMEALRRAEYGAKAAIDRAFAAREVTGRATWPEAVRRYSYFAVVLAELGVQPDEADPLVDALEAEHHACSLWRVREAEACTVLAALRGRGFVLAAVSNADGRVEDDLVAYGLRPYLDAVVDSHVVGVEKPHPAIFALALARLGVPPAAAVHVGDIAAIDVAGARRAGVRAVLMDPLGCYPGVVDCPRIRGLGELLDILPAQAVA